MSRLPSTIAIASILLLPQLAVAQERANIVGRVVDGVNGHALVSAAVRVRPLDGASWAMSARTDTAGAFEVANVPFGSYVLEITRAGYVPHSDTLHLARETVTHGPVRLNPVPLEVAPLPVVASEERHARLMPGFWERRKQGVGYFITREQIAAMRATSFMNVLRTIPELVVQPADAKFSPTGNLWFRRHGQDCRIAVFIDGVPFAGGVDYMHSFGPENVEAVEAYSGSARVPAQFNATGDDKGRGSPQCGVIVVWTRKGD